MGYSHENEAKANFNDVYTAPTPHAYIAKMARHNYQIGEQARPYCIAAAELLRKNNGEIWPVQMLDVGCSYGIGSAFVRYGCSFEEIIGFFASRAPEDYASCCEVTRMWLNVTSPICNIRSVGLDNSGPAIKFALGSGLLDGGIARDFENPEVMPTEDEQGWIRSCNLLVSTGAIGYVTEKTLNKILPYFGKDHPSDFGPLAVITILRIFDSEPIIDCFKRFGFDFQRVEGIRLPQRDFVDEVERVKVLEILREKGLDASEFEEAGTHYADLYVAAPAEQIDILINEMRSVREQFPPQKIAQPVPR
ncbi:MAG: hypothetical protein GF315_01140 [candidate division Zixibacteria bacterium]|nr:hypothetical protein [candidate division Zixibacteria bacterium]